MLIPLSSFQPLSILSIVPGVAGVIASAFVERRLPNLMDRHRILVV